MKFTNKRGQLAMFIIIAIAIVGIILLIYAFRDKLFPSAIPTDFVPVFNNYESCIKQQAQAAAELAGTQGGRVDPGTYIPGSDFAPFSSHLNFLGFPVPYWYYIAGNGLVKENVPTKTEMQNDIAGYIERRLNNCNFDTFYPQGFYVQTSQPTAKVTISDNSISISVTAPLTVTKEGQSARKTDFTETIDSRLGKFYSTALSIYNYEKQSAVLENYAVDAIWNYAPVDGVELQCAPKIWKTNDVISELKNGISANIGELKFQGSYYTLQNKERSYFVVNQPVDVPVRLIYSPSWPTKVEISGDGVNNDLITANAVGAAQGLGAVGFCYVPYHFVYDVSFPVMVQIYDGTELFQFPIAVIVNKNQPRMANVSDTVAEGTPPSFDLCQYKTQGITVNLYDVHLNPVNANVTYECFDQRCLLGESTNGHLTTKAPACVNGYLKATAGGYADKSQLFSTNRETSADMVLDKEYSISVNIKKGGSDLPSGSSAIVMFTNLNAGNQTTSATIPGFSQITLSEGLYDVTVYVYDNSSITIPSSTKEQCFDAPQNGVLGFLGMTHEQCVKVTIPSTKVDYALSGGGDSQQYIFPDDLAKGKLTIDVASLPKPNSIEELGNNIAQLTGKEATLAFG